MKRLKIIHVSPENISAISSTFVNTHRELGHEALLVTFIKSQRGYDDELIINYPFFNERWMRMIKNFMGKGDVVVENTPAEAPVWGSGLNGRLFRLRDFFWEYWLRKYWYRYRLWDFDIYHFDTGVPFIFGDRIVKKLKRLGKKIVAFYCGTDLRKRGVDKSLERYVDLNLTCEYDHLLFYDNLHYVFMPFDFRHFQVRSEENSILKVCHAPSRRGAKGTKHVIEAVDKVKKKIDFEFILIENVPYEECIRLKSSCDIGIEQVGSYAGTGYGRNSLEFLAMGIPTITEIPDGYEKMIPDHPFIKADRTNIAEVLLAVIKDKKLRMRKSTEGRRWVEKYHDPKKVVLGIYKMYKEKGWIR